MTLEEKIARAVNLGVADIDVWCHDNIADRDVDVDTGKIRELIDL